jgi:hypothetical protein
MAIFQGVLGRLRALRLRSVVGESGYEPGGREFESLRARQQSNVHSGDIGDGLYRPPVSG